MDPTANPHPETIEIRNAVEFDAPALAWVLVAAWRAAYAGIIDAEFLEAMNVQQISGRWANSLGRDTGEKPLVAVLAGEVVGFCQFGVPREESAKGTVQCPSSVHPGTRRRRATRTARMPSAGSL